MKTWEEVENLEQGESVNLLGSTGDCKIRRTSKGVIITNSAGNFFCRNNDIKGCFGNLNAIGLQSLDTDYVTNYRYSA